MAAEPLVWRVRLQVRGCLGSATSSPPLRAAPDPLLFPWLARCPRAGTRGVGSAGASPCALASRTLRPARRWAWGVLSGWHRLPPVPRTPLLRPQPAALPQLLGVGGDGAGGGGAGLDPTPLPCTHSPGQDAPEGPWLTVGWLRRTPQDLGVIASRNTELSFDFTFHLS